MANPNPGVNPNLVGLDPTKPLTPPQIVTLAHGIANAQTVGPLRDLAASIAQTNRGTTASEKLVGGYFDQFGKSAQQGVNDTTRIGTNLQDTLGGINQDTQTQLQGIGQNAAGAINAYMPAGDQSLGSGPLQSLAANMARQQGYAAQYGGIAAGTGALQSANYSDMAAGMKGTGAVAGTQALGELARAGRLAVQPLTQKVADLKQQRGTLYANALGSIRQQEFTNLATEQGLSNTLTGIQTTAATAAANRRFTAKQAKLDRQNRIAVENSIQTGANTRSQDAIDARKAATDAAARAKKVAAGGGPKPLIQSEQNSLFQQLDSAISHIPTIFAKGIKNSKGVLTVAKPTQQQVAALFLQSGYPRYLVDAAFELLHQGTITPATAREMRAAGLRGGFYKGAPIRVRRTGPSPSASVGGVSSAGSGAAGGVTSVAG